MMSIERLHERKFMNIGETVKKLQKDFPSVTISRLRFLEKEGLISSNSFKRWDKKFQR